MATYLPAFLAAGLLCLIAVPPLALLRERALLHCFALSTKNDTEE